MSALAARESGRGEALVAFSLTFLGIFLSVILCFEIAERNAGIAPIWLANATLLALILNRPSRRWRLFLVAGYLAVFAANILHGDTVAKALVLGIANTVEVLAVGIPLRFLGFDRRLTRLSAVGMLCALACGPAVGLSALVASTYLSVFHGASFYEVYFTWYVADVLALVTATPVLAAFRLDEFLKELKGPELPQNIALLVFVFVAFAFIFFAARVPLLFLVFPPLLMVTFRLGFSGGALALALAAIFSVWSTAAGMGPLNFIEASFGEKIVFIQIYLAILNFTILQTAATLAAKRKAELKLQRMNSVFKRAKENAEAARQEAEEADRGKSAFLASMSHELRTPLNAIIGFSEVMKRETFGPLGREIYVDYANDIHKSGQHLLALVNDVLELSRISSGRVELEKEIFDLKHVLHEGIAIVAPQATANGVKVAYDFDESEQVLLADRRRILQIFLNLLSNAVKFTPAGREVRIACGQENGNAYFSVADEGIGIAEEDIPKVLSHYGQANGWIARRNQGHGLGLPIAKQLTELHGGALSIRSARNHGTVVMISLPLGTAPSQSSPEEYRPHLTAVA